MLRSMKSISKLCSAAARLRKANSTIGTWTQYVPCANYVNPIDGKRLPVSSAAKALAVYLKTVCYLSGYGRPGLVEVIYPPFDQSLMKVLSLGGKTFPGDHEYDHDDHMERVKVARREASKRKCSPIELEQFWRPD